MPNSETSGFAPTEDVIAAEAAILGAAIQNKTAAERMAEIVRPIDFWKTKHQVIAEAIDELIQHGKPISVVGVLHELTCLGRVHNGSIDGNDLFRLAERYSTSLDRDARIVAADAERRRVMLELSTALETVAKPGFNTETDMDAIRQRLDKAVTATSDTAETVGELLIPHLEELQRPLTIEDCVPVPYLDLQSALGGGLRPGQFAVIGARPSVGKSLAALDFARHAAIKCKEKLPVLFISMEMSKKEVMNRLLSAESGVLLQKFIKHELDDNDWEQIARIQDRVFDAPIIIDDRPQCTIGRVRGRLRGMARTNPCRLLIIDYLTLMQVPHAESRERQVAELSRALKVLAMEFQLPVVVVHQLNRESERRTDKIPAIHDLRESGQIEADADIIILLHREDVHEPESPRSGELDLRVDKNRNGPKCVITVGFQGHRGRLVNFENPDGPDPYTHAKQPANRSHLAAVPD